MQASALTDDKLSSVNYVLYIGKNGEIIQVLNLQE